MNNSYVWLAIAVIALVTAFLRFLPFILFNGKRKTPRIIDKLGKLLPNAIMGMLAASPSVTTEADTSDRAVA